MQFYFVVMFLHITSALALFMGMAIEWVGISKLQFSSDKVQVSDWVIFLLSLKTIFISSGTLLLITGAYMASAKWGWTPWIIVSMLLWLYITLHGSMVTGKKIKNINVFLNSDVNKSFGELREHINKLKLINRLQSEIAVGLGTIFIMTVKPDITGSIVVVIIAVILGAFPYLLKPKTSVPN